MKFTETAIPGVWIIEPQLFRDGRGYFYESFNLKKFEEGTGLALHFVQDNHSFSTYGVLRGLHFQYEEAAQAKLIRVISGNVLDVAVDIRPGSPTFGEHISVELSGENKKQLFIPRGFAHAFAVLSDHCEFTYKCDNFYAPTKESGLAFNDPSLGIDWRLPQKDIILSERDKNHPFLADINFQFHEA